MMAWAAILYSYLLIGLVSGFLSRYIAKRRSLSGTLYFWIGFFVPIVGIILAAVMPPQTRGTEETP